MKSSKKGIEFGWATVVYAVLAVILMLAIWYVFKSGTGKGLDNINIIGDDAVSQAKGEKCRSFFTANKCIEKDEDCSDGRIESFSDCSKCCVRS